MKGRFYFIMDAISTHFPRCPSFNSIRHWSSSFNDKIRSIAHSALTELSAALALNIAFNVAFGVIMLPPSTHLMTVVCGLAVIGLVAFKVMQACRSHFGVPLKEGARSLARFSMVNTGLMKISLYMHELGHAAAAMLCFIQADPKIIVRGFEGMTEYNISYGLTSFGEWLGEQPALLFAASGGLISTVIFAVGEFAAAHALQEKHPIISEILTYHGISQILYLTLYGFSAFRTSKSHLINDFIFLWVRGGIHPLVPIGLVIAVPLCTWMAIR